MWLSDEGNKDLQKVKLIVGRRAEKRNQGKGKRQLVKWKTLVSDFHYSEDKAKTIRDRRVKDGLAQEDRRDQFSQFVHRFVICLVICFSRTLQDPIHPHPP